MDKREALRTLVADFFEVPKDRVHDAFRLAGPRMQSSVARYALDAGIRRKVGLSSRAVYTAATFGELAAALLEPAATPAPLAAPAVQGAVQGFSPTLLEAPGVVPLSGNAVQGVVSCGTDIETVDNLPKAADCWRSDFYQENFAPSEIAYCLLQENPPVHFAGRWCAKEALKKCDNGMMHEPMKNLELAREATGEVFFLHHGNGASRRLPFAVSISHTATTATAVVVRITAPPLAPSTAASASDPPLTDSAPVSASVVRGESVIRTLLQDLRRKAEWYGMTPTPKAIARICLSNGTSAQLLYRAMQFCQRNRLKIVAAALNRLNFHVGNAVIGRGADIGPGFVILHSSGVCINTSVRAGKNLVIEHNVTIGEEQSGVPVIGDNVYIGAGATIVGGVRIGSNVKIAANSLVMKDVPDGATAIGVPAQVVRIDKTRMGPQSAKDAPPN